MASRFAVSMLALLGSAAAQGFNMTTTSGNMTAAVPSTMSMKHSSSSAPYMTSAMNMTTSASRTSSPKASMTGSMTSSATPVTTPASLLTLDGVEFLIELDVIYTGIFLELAIIFAKRDTYTLNDCLKTCADNSQCVGTAYNTNTSDCTFYSSITADSKMVSNGTDFGTVVSRASNSTTGSGTSSNTTAEALICPSYNGHVITSSQTANEGPVSFAIECGEILVGTTFPITSMKSKRQSGLNTGLPITLSNCVDICATNDACVGTSFDSNTETCTYYSDVSYAVAVAGMDSATRVAGSGVAANPSATVTVTATVVSASVSTVYPAAGTTTTTVYAGAGNTPTTTTVTVGAGAADTTAYPSGAVVTTMVPVGTTTYLANGISTVGNAAGGVQTVTVTAYATSAVSYCPDDVTFTTVYYQ